MRLSNGLAACLVVALASATLAGEVEIPVPRGEALVGLNLGGSHSCYVINGRYTTGWARYVETVPATRLLAGIGVWGTRGLRKSRRRRSTAPGM